MITHQESRGARSPRILTIVLFICILLSPTIHNATLADSGIVQSQFQACDAVFNTAMQLACTLSLGNNYSCIRQGNVSTASCDNVEIVPGVPVWGAECAGLAALGSFGGACAPANGNPLVRNCTCQFSPIL
jgi:hypothetical protein